MEIDELINKFSNDDKFREEIIIIGKEGGLKAVIKKYELPYTEEEITEVVKARMEQSNCDGSTSEIIAASIATLGILCIVHAASK